MTALGDQHHRVLPRSGRKGTEQGGHTRRDLCRRPHDGITPLVVLRQLHQQLVEHIPDSLPPGVVLVVTSQEESHPGKTKADSKASDLVKAHLGVLEDGVYNVSSGLRMLYAP